MPDGGDLFGMSQRVPPQNQRAEQALLGALLANNKAYDRVGSFLAPEHFADAAHGLIYAAVARNIEAGRPVDAVTLQGEFDGSGALEGVGGSGYLATLLGAMIGITNVGEYGRAIYDAWLRREAIGIGEALVSDGFSADPTRTPETVVTEAVESLLQLGERVGSSISGATSIGSALNGAVLRAEAAHRGDSGQTRLDTGVQSFDSLWQGLWPGQLYYLMARSRTGKSPAMAQIARNVGARLLAESQANNTPLEHVHVFSLEMTAEDYATINLAATTPWTADQIRSGRVSDWHALMEQSDALARLPIVIDDTHEMTIADLVTRARLVKRTKRTRLVMIDYRELIRRGRDEARMGLPEWIPLLGYKLKALAKMLGVPVVALAQINKSRDKQESARPVLGDLPYDGGQAADGVFALYRREVDMDDSPPSPAPGLSTEKRANLISDWERDRAASRGVAQFGALKRRFGAQGWTTLRFDGPRMTFREAEDVRGDEPPDLWEGT